MAEVASRLEKQALSREHQQGGYLEGTSRDTPQVVFEDVAPQDALPQGTPTPTVHIHSLLLCLPPLGSVSQAGPLTGQAMVMPMPTY